MPFSDRDFKSLGAMPGERGTRFMVWAPKAQDLALVIEGDSEKPIQFDRDENGYHALTTDRAPIGTRYRLEINGESRFPDPASRYQPEGVHGPSEVVDLRAHQWSKAPWKGIPLAEMVVYELHVGTFTPAGTFKAATERLQYLHELGVNTVELMPVADFPGERNWGYDHGALFAPSRAYGRPEDLQQFVDRAHQLGMAVLLDVIYNHFGPDGAYAAAFAPFFTERHHTPWGLAMNLDDEQSRGVRDFFIDNALYWLRDFRLDGLRLDATHALIDDSDEHFLAELRRAVDSTEGPRRVLIAEDHRNLKRVLDPVDEGGYGIDAVWADDIHHLLRHQTAGDEEAYYADYAGTNLRAIARTINRGWYFDGTVEPQTDREHGTDPTGLRPEQFVYCIQNHDQVGNRPLGNRLTDDIDLATYRALSALLLFLPHTPMLFMGQEWATSTPFLFFTDHEAELGRAVTEGRRNEFKGFGGFKGDVPDPQAEETFLRSKLDWDERFLEPHSFVIRLYRDLLQLRRSLSGPCQADVLDGQVLRVRRNGATLFVALRPDASCETSDLTITSHTQEERYGGLDDEHPFISSGRLHFPAPAAILSIDA
jgi:maltooligosyltrehalose trehalohydrolase